MRIPMLVLAGLIVAYLAPDYFRRSPAQPFAPPSLYYVNGQPMMSNPNPADPEPAEHAARGTHQAALNSVYAAFGYPWRAMCALEQRLGLVTALNTYYSERLRIERRGRWARSDEWKGTA